ncbi:mechanosensitive ion channel family protein [Sediminibacterium roseum]|uniref:Mechanosensitive ion channel family protein n=1 Tax=Sediminibacterium roseum TaxID=1978412 RepID=A0ABX0A0J6_9BACT|nr:mechanosensitive ion channel family protein [Sediminibacterium roseum]NCI51823.1 mechanosensitive ion channel family protein [Sediminibacterium roseum]
MDMDKFYDKALTWLVNAGPRVLLALVVFFAGQWLIRLLRKWTHRSMQQKNFAPSLRPFLLGLLFTTLQVLLVIAIMQILGIEMSIFAALIASVGVAAGLALSGTLQNFTSGILILVLKPYRVGDNVLAQGQEGTVDSIQLFYTVIKTYDNRTVIIPNSKLSNEQIVNLSREGTRRLDTEMKVAFPVPFEQIRSVVETAIRSRSAVLQSPAYRIGVSHIDPDCYRIIINLWLPAHGFEDERQGFREALLKALVASGIKLPDAIHL